MAQRRPHRHANSVHSGLMCTHREAHTFSFYGLTLILEIEVEVTTLQLIFGEGFKVYSFQLRGLFNESRIDVFRHHLPVLGTGTVSLGSRNRFSDSHSGIEPLFPDTRYRHSRQVTYSRKLIGQTFEGPVDDAKPSVICNNYLESSEMLQSIYSRRNAWLLF
ncbi:unnamed protein product [Hymenolepis diminuta]|uniref:Uncharacterized protein n=1 Tax=Hymenolepis diminuta TaxID=6216 RepID=A0A0R3SP56_HYMDI|nr:unnamed protein product [Hymenolepis diminuta]